MRRLVWLGLLFWLPFIAFAEPVYLSGLRIQPGPASSRFIFTLSQKTYGLVKYTPTSRRLIIEFKNTQQRFRIHDAKLMGSNVESITTHKTANTVQFILRVRNRVKWNTHFLPEEVDKSVQLQWDVISINSSPPPRLHKPLKTLTQNKVVITKKQVKQTIRQVDQLLASHTPLVNKPSVVKLDKEKINKIVTETKVESPAKPQQFVVVIDAGHGGKDTGAIGARGRQEKTVVLNIAKKLAQEINATPNMRAVMTRNGDFFVTLYDRLKLARKGEADLFVAIHADAHFDKKAAGASVYTLSQRGASTMAARWLALRENHSELGDVQLNELEDQSTTLRSVLIDMAQIVTHQDSMRVASKILDAVETIAALHYSHVERAPFLVLKSPDIPSVLVETGFISNRREEERLANPAYQQKLAHAVWQGIRQYMVKYATVN